MENTNFMVIVFDCTVLSYTAEVLEDKIAELLGEMSLDGHIEDYITGFISLEDAIEEATLKGAEKARVILQALLELFEDEWEARSFMLDEYIEPLCR